MNHCRNVNIYSCSGGKKDGRTADDAARQAAAQGAGEMGCTARVGAADAEAVEQANVANRNVVIDGCALDCARRVFERAGIHKFVHVRVSDLPESEREATKVAVRVVAIARQSLDE